MSLTEIASTVSFFFPLLVGGVMWVVAWRRREARPFWAWLALGWTLNLVGNVAWAAHDILTETRLPPLSWVDLFYVARYVCLGIAFWLYPAPWETRRLREVGGLVLLAALALWVALYRTEFVTVQRSWDQVLGVAIYPLLDVGLIYILAFKWREMPVEPWRRSLLLLLIAAISYGIANGINLCVRLAEPENSSAWADLFWFANELFALAAAAWFIRKTAR